MENFRVCDYKIVVKGVVQGVGFRPFIYNLAKRFGFSGSVLNSCEGVFIEIKSSKDMLKSFLQEIRTNHPPLAKIDSIEFFEISSQDRKVGDGDEGGRDECNGNGGEGNRKDGKSEDFIILKSLETKGFFTAMPPDVSICFECEKELLDSNNRRKNYPFITCTNCGSRYTIIKKLPYDRKNTSMNDFEMCKNCENEYLNPQDRRYHAQPIGCFDCGPVLSLYDNSGKKIDIDPLQIINKIAIFLKEGKIVALKGVGGYHLICDATNDFVLKLLRMRKRRPSKPFAVMVKDLKSAMEIAKIDEFEAKFLTSKERPIVLLEKLKEGRGLSDGGLSSLVAPDIGKIGVFLPYTPLHFLLLNQLDFPIVATSANLSDEPLCQNFQEILKLNDVWDYCVEHDRQIVNGCDDSVLGVVGKKSIFFRRARGYAPKAVDIGFKTNQKVLSLGANQKATIAIGIEDKIILSPHIGDLETINSVKYFENNIETLKNIYGFKPDIIACDPHRGYESSKLAPYFASLFGSKILEVQHHYAHILAVMAEHKLDEKVLGVAFDGTGYGDDGKLWGGEFLICDTNGYERIFYFDYFKLLGGERAIKEPKRVALSFLFELFGKKSFKLDLPVIKAFSGQELNMFYEMWNKNLNAPLSSSVGRIFDAVASLVDILQVGSYEGQSGMMIEEYWDGSVCGNYDFEILENKIIILPMMRKIVEDFVNLEPRNIIISKFINTIAQIIVEISLKFDLKIVLGGGVFQNVTLLKILLKKLPSLYFGEQVPPNDGAISLGQTYGSFLLHR